MEAVSTTGVRKDAVVAFPGRESPVTVVDFVVPELEMALAEESEVVRAQTRTS